MAKVMNHRIEKLLSLLDANQTQLNLSNINEIKIEHENALNETSDDNSCSSIIKVKPLFIVQKSKRFKVASNIKCTTSSQLNIHKLKYSRIDSKQKRFACDQCPKTFTRKSSLLVHKRIHTGEKPYECDECPFKCTQSHHLIRHKRIHSGEKPHSCDICPKKFARLDSLTEHKRVHTGEKPFQCDLCLKKFAQLTNLIRHKKIHTTASTVQ